MTSLEAVLLGGLAVGIVFGAAARLSAFCLLSGLRGWWGQDDGRPVRTFALALVVALVGSQWLQTMGMVDLSQSIYARTTFSPVAVFIGGLAFGVGMVLANGCGARAAVLLGGGNLRSLIVLLCIGIGGYIALSGLLAPLRVAADRLLSVQFEAGTIPALLDYQGLDAVAATWLMVALVAAALLFFAFSHAAFRRAHSLQLGGLVVGCAIVAGWYVTGRLGADDFDPAPVMSASFIAPVGDSILYLMLASGMKLNFGIVLVAGVVIGSFLLAALQGALKLEGFVSPGAMVRSMAGGLLMGVGGAFAAGCSIGHGLSGLSTLGWMSLPAVIGILIGTAIALRLPRRADAVPAMNNALKEENT
ncbi:MAG: YeeE/YedE family protein [Pseudaminobacter sp.]